MSPYSPSRQEGEFLETKLPPVPILENSEVQEEPGLN